MKVAIERKRPMIKKLFRGMQEADYESAFVTIEFSEEERQVIVQNRLGERLVYEDPRDLPDYEEGQEVARTHPNSYAGQHPAPRYKRSKFVGHFLKEATQEVYSRLDTPMRFAEIQSSVQQNLKDLKELISSVQSYPTDKASFEI